MSNLIRFLESMGSDARLAAQTGPELERRVFALALPEAQGRALCDRDTGALLRSLNASQQFIALLVPGEPEQPDQPGPDKEPPAPGK